MNLLRMVQDNPTHQKYIVPNNNNNIPDSYTWCVK